MFSKFLKIFLSLSFCITFSSILIYIVAQQIFRQSANIPLLEMADNRINKLIDGTPAESLISDKKIDISREFDPFVILFNSDGDVIASEALLNGKTPIPPKGVFEYTFSHGIDKITWQPAPKTRIATVLVNYGGTTENKFKNSGIILVGKRLEEIEKPENNIFKLILTGWIAGIFGSGVLALALSRLKK